MSGRTARNKGQRAELAADRLLAARDWQVIRGQAGSAVEDFIAVDPDGVTYAVEVKNQRNLQVVAFRRQAIAQAERRRMRWMVVAWLDGYRSALVLRQGLRPAVWHESGNIEETDP